MAEKPENLYSLGMTPKELAEKVLEDTSEEYKELPGVTLP